MKYDTSKGLLLELQLSDIKKIEYVHGIEPSEGIQSAYDRTGCHIIINANFFGLSNGGTVGEVVDEGKILSTNSLSPYGFAFVNKVRPVFSYKNDVDAIDFLGGYPSLVKNNEIYIDTTEYGFSATSTYDVFKRGRTALGIKSDGTFIVRCIGDNNTANKITIPELAKYMKNIGCVNAVNLDGGGSTSWITPWSKFITSRKLDGFVCIWLNNMYYKIRLGAYSQRSGAEKVLAALKAAGFTDSYIKFE